MDTEKRYSIGELAKAAEVPTSTLRYYEKIELIVPAGRGANNYRFYTEESLKTVQFIRAAQTTGFTLDDTKTLLGLCDAKNVACKEIRPLIEDRFKQVSRQIEEMQHIENILKTALKACRSQKEDELCHVIDELNASSL